MIRKKRKRKEPSVLRKMVEVLYEDVKRRRALRLLSKQAWSLDFLSMALVKAGKSLNENLVMVITDRNGVKLELRYDDVKDRAEDDNVFMHLDDDSFVEKFIRENARR